MTTVSETQKFFWSLFSIVFLIIVVIIAIGVAQVVSPVVGGQTVRRVTTGVSVCSVAKIPNAVVAIVRGEALVAELVPTQRACRKTVSQSFSVQKI